MLSQIYPPELQLNKANTSDTEVAFLDLHLYMSNDIVSTKIYDKLGDLMLKMPFLLLNNLNDINCGHVRKCVMRSIIFWTI